MKLISDHNTFVQPVCNKCKYHFGGAECAAFPRIPDDILEGVNQHTKPTLHQKNSIVFAPVESVSKKVKDGWEEVPRVPAGSEGGGQWTSAEIPATGIGSKNDRLWQDADGVQLYKDYHDASKKWAEADKAGDTATAEIWDKKTDEARRKYIAWKDSVKAAYSAGHLSDSDIENIEKAIGNLYLKFVPVGDQDVYHVSVSADLVEKIGLLTKSEVQDSKGKMGLGGGDGISLTTDVTYAEKIYRVFNEIKDALNGKVNIADEFKGFDTTTQDKIVKQMASHLGGEEADIRYAIENNKDGYERRQLKGDSIVKERVENWKFISHYYNIMTLLADGKNGREWLALSTYAAQHFKDADIGIFKGRTRPNAKGELYPAEREVRVFSGDAVHKMRRIDKKRKKPTDFIQIDFTGIVKVKSGWEEVPRAPKGSPNGGQWISGSDVPAEVSEEVPITQDEIKAIKQYTGSGGLSYKVINEYLRTGKTTFKFDDVGKKKLGKKDLDEAISLIDSFLEKSEKWDGGSGYTFTHTDVLERGMKISNSELLGTYKNLKKGDIFSSKSFMSAVPEGAETNGTDDDDGHWIAGYFMQTYKSWPDKKVIGNVLFKIKTKSGVDISKHSKQRDEYEVLIPRNKKFRVTKAKNSNYSFDGGNWMEIHIEEI